jgi:ParB/RepB/Spo0J family partition protein
VREPVYDSLCLTEIDVTKNIRGVTTASEELIASVRARGVATPVLVRLAPAGSDYVYEMLDGHRRHAAATACQHNTIPARMFDLTDREHREIQFECEGLHEALGPLDRARALKTLIDEHGLTQEEAGALVEGGRSQGWVSSQLSLIEDLPAGAQDLISRQILSAAGGAELLRARKLPKAMASAEKALLDFAAGEGVTEISVGMVQNIVAAAIDEHSKDLGGQNGHLFFDTAACQSCGNRVRGRYAERCADPKCWKEKQAAGRAIKVEEAKTRARAGEAAWGDDQFLTPAFGDCPKTCKERAMCAGYSGSALCCLTPDSDCYRERKAAQPKPVKPNPAEQRAKEEAETKGRREAEDAWRAQEAGRLKRVRRYLKKRAGLTEDETRLLCLGIVSRTIQWADLEQTVGLPLGDLVRRALGHLLEAEPARAWDETLRRWVPLDEPTRYDGLRHGLIGWAPGGADPDPQTDPESELAPLSVEKASYGPNPEVTECRETREPATAEECLACCSKQLWWSATETSAQGGHGLSGACCGHVTSGLAPFRCPGQLDICPTEACAHD